MELHGGSSYWSSPSAYFCEKRREITCSWLSRSGIIQRGKKKVFCRFSAFICWESQCESRLLSCYCPLGWFTAESEHHARHVKAAGTGRSSELHIWLHQGLKHFTSTFFSRSGKRRRKSSDRLIISSPSLIASSGTRLKSFIQSSQSRLIETEVRNSQITVCILQQDDSTGCKKMLLISFSVLLFSCYFSSPGICGNWNAGKTQRVTGRHSGSASTVTSFNHGDVAKDTDWVSGPVHATSQKRENDVMTLTQPSRWRQCARNRDVEEPRGETSNTTEQAKQPD